MHSVVIKVDGEQPFIFLRQVVGVDMFSQLDLRCRRSVDPNFDVGASPWIWTCHSSLFFFARDYCTDDSAPVLVDPLKVIIDDGKGGLGNAELNETMAVAFQDFDSVTVNVAPETDFQGVLEIFDGDSGDVVASFEASEADYDAATGVAVFDLSSEDPFEPGLYEVRVGSKYLAEVYIAIPGDVNLDGMVDDSDVEIIQQNLSSSGMWMTGDVNCDGVVDGLDLAIVEMNLVLLGDINRDGVVDFNDIGPFIDVVLGGPTQVEADINQDGVVDFDDIVPFIALVLS